MLRSRRTAAAVASLAAVAFAVSVTTASAEGPSDAQTDSVADAVSAYQSAFPGISPDAARKAALQQDSRKQLYDLLAGKGGGTTFGGAWFDPPTGVLHVMVTNAEAGDGSVDLAKQLDLAVQPQIVEHSYSELETQLARLRAGTDALAKVAKTNGGIDVKRNAVVVSVTNTQLTELADAAKSAGVILVLRPSQRIEQDAGCTSRAACDWTIRGGSMLWNSVPGNNVCSVGFTARNASNTRYTFTAGHCSSGNGVPWGTGGIGIGPMTSSRNTGPVDASIIQVTNPWFQFDSGGEIYNQFAPNHSVAVNYVAPSLGYIWSGDVVCLAANYTQPSGNSFCGVVGTNSDPNVRGMVRVDGLDACPGDSGGGWYWLTNSGRRIAYGLHSRSDFGCHGSSGGSHSWFSALPTIKSSYLPALNVETR